MNTVVATQSDVTQFSQAVLLITALSEAGVTEVLSWAGHLEQRFMEYPDTPDKPDNVKHQRMLINRALRLMLNTVPNSFNARLALLDNHITEKDWINTIKKFTLPFMIENGLFK